MESTHSLMLLPNAKSGNAGPRSRRPALSGFITVPATILAGIFVGVTSASAPFEITAITFAGLLAVLLSFYRPDLTAALFFCGIILMTDSPPDSETSCFYLLDADIIHGLPSTLTTMFLLTLGMSVLRLFLLEKKQFPVTPVPLQIYGGILLLALFTGLTRGSPPDQIRVDFMDMLFPAFCFYLCMMLLTNRHRIIWLLGLLTGAAALKAALLVIAYISGHGWPYETYQVVTTDSADLLAFITLGLVATHLITRRDLSGLKATLTGMACLPLLFAIIFSYRRAQWGGTVLSLGLLFWGATGPVRRNIILSILILLCTAGAMAVIAGVGQNNTARIASRLTSIFDKDQPSNMYHREESKQVLKDLSTSPLLGLGLGSNHTPLNVHENDQVPTNIVHNTFLYIWMKTGLPGLLFFLWMFVRYARRILDLRKRAFDTLDWGLALPLAASSGLWLAMFMTGPTIWYFHQTSLIALFTAMTLSLTRQPASASSLNPGGQT